MIELAVVGMILCIVGIVVSLKLCKQVDSDDVRCTGKEILLSIKETYEDEDEDIVTIDGFDDAIIGVDSLSGRVIYSERKCIAILCKDMSEEEALDYYRYNIEGSCNKTDGPILCYDRVN